MTGQELLEELQNLTPKQRKLPVTVEYVYGNGEGSDCTGELTVSDVDVRYDCIALSS